MNLLAIDTSGPILSIALQCGDKPIQEKVHLGAMEHMENIFPFIDELLRAQNLKPNQIDAYLINRGPGSFTGLRIGFSTLKGFLAASTKPCYGCDSLDVLAERIPTIYKKNLAVCLDAFRAKFYIKIFENRDGAWIPTAQAQSLNFEEACHQIPAEAFIAGNALERHCAVFEKFPEKKLRSVPEELWYPRASSMIRLQKSRPEAVKKLLSSSDFLPLYLRLSEPEERKAELKLK